MNSEWVVSEVNLFIDDVVKIMLKLVISHEAGDNRGVNGKRGRMGVASVCDELEVEFTSG